MSHSRDEDTTLLGLLKRTTGLNAAKCYQCGKCTAGCPMAEEMPLKVHQIMRLIQLDQPERIYRDESIWLCLTCETCSTRCPMNVEPARLIDGLREIAEQVAPEGAPRRIRAFHTSFREQIRFNGRLHEFSLVMAYKLRSGALLDDVTAAPGMLTRGKLAFVPRRIDGLDDVRRIFDACEAETQQEE